MAEHEPHFQRNREMLEKYENALQHETTYEDPTMMVKWIDGMDTDYLNTLLHMI